MKLARGIAAGLALLLAVQPTVVLAASARSQDFDEVYAGYLRGEVSLSEMEAARQERDRRVRQRARSSVGPSAPEDMSGLVTEEAAPEGLGTRVKKIGAWIRDIPKRTLRRVAPEDDGLQTAAEANQHIESSKVPAYTANAAQREADSTWVRPVKVTAQAEVNKVQSVVERVVAFGGLTALAKAAGGDAQAKAVVSKATQVVGKLGGAEKKALLAGLKGGAFGKALGGMINGPPKSALGRIVKDKFGNNIFLAVAASGIVNAVLDDGLDLSTMKDQLVALNAISTKRTRREDLLLQPLEAVGYYHADRAVSSAWQKIWSGATSGSGRFATWLRGADDALKAAGSRFVKTPPAHLAEKAAAFGRQASSLGLPGVSGATSLSLMGAAESIFKAGTLGLVGMPVIETGWRAIAGEREGVVIGGNRERTFAMYNFYDTYYQRTGNKWKDGLEERKNSISNLWEGYEKFPFTNSFNWFLRFVGGYTGAVIASSVVAPVGFATFGISLVVSAIFAEGGVAIGKWAGAKVDTSPGFYRRLRKKNMKEIYQLMLANSQDCPERQVALEALGVLDKLRSELGIRSQKDMKRLLASGSPDSERLSRAARAYTQAKRAYLAMLARKAEARADDYEAMMKVSQVNSRIKFVRSFDDVKLYRDKGYIQMEMPGFRKHASPRYDIVTEDGRRGVWDFKSNRIIDVGKIHENNGKRITFLDDAGVEVEGGVLQSKDQSELEKAVGNAFVTKNGIILEKAPKGARITQGKKKGKRKSEWLVRGYGGEYDIVLRQSGRRFVWNGEAYVEAGSEAEKRFEAAAEQAKAEAEAAARTSQPGKQLSERARRKLEKKAAKKARKAAAAKAAEAEAEKKAQEFSAEVVQDLVRSVAKDPSPSDSRAVLEGLSDLGKLYKSSGDSLGERFGKVLASRI